MGIMFNLGVFTFNTPSTSRNSSGSWEALMGAGLLSPVGSKAIKGHSLSTQDMWTCHADINEAPNLTGKSFQSEINATFFPFSVLCYAIFFPPKIFFPIRATTKLH